jgi:hypothetical protein
MPAQVAGIATGEATRTVLSVPTTVPRAPGFAVKCPTRFTLAAPLLESFGTAVAATKVPVVSAALRFTRKNCCEPAAVLVVLMTIETTRTVLVAEPSMMTRSVGVAAGVKVELAQ